MLKRKLIFVAGAMAVLAAITVALNQRETNPNIQVVQLVAEKGTPTFLAKWLEVEKRRVRVLRLLVLPQDPQAVTNWNSISNVTLVWAESEPGRRNARYFYDEMKSDKSFDGSAWYSRRSLFRGEK